MKNNKLNIYFLVIILVLTALLFLDKRFLPGKSPVPQFSRNNADLIGTVMQLIKTDYLEEPNPLRTTEGAFRGLINSLDPLSAYLDKDLAAKYLNRKAPAENTGLILYKKYGLFPVVAAVAENSPAARAGLKVGDNISGINDRNTLNMSLLEVNLLLEATGQQDDQPVKLRVVRGNDTLEFQVARNFTSPQSLKLTAEKTGLLLLKPTAIYPGLSQEIKKSITASFKKKDSNVRAVVLDLRECFNGDYEEARKVINLFLKAEEIGYFERRGQKEPLSCLENPSFPQQKLFVWVNQATYGPAELIAAVLQDFKRAKVIGIETPGLVGKQEHFPISDGSLIVLTTAVFSLKSGTRLWDNSVPLDVKLTYAEKMEQTYLDKTRGLLTSAD
ncbi:MAG: PDZ domain-containing protein [Candidatus Aminicenantes bacterium]|nr:PDZ domain-containing protein [Candidatus Aminicenantes bacterium]